MPTASSAPPLRPPYHPPWCRKCLYRPQHQRRVALWASSSVRRRGHHGRRDDAVALRTAGRIIELAAQANATPREAEVHDRSRDRIGSTASQGTQDGDFMNTVEGPPREAFVNASGVASRLPPNGTHLRSMTSAEVLRQRPSRPPDYAAENLALIGLAQSLATAPEEILQRLADTALNICRAHSAGLSLLEASDQQRHFHWRAIAGEFAHHLNGGTPRDFGPCGTVLDRNAAQLCSHPEMDFPYFSETKPPLDEILLVPFYIEGAAAGTIWVVSHDVARRRFDAEDLRVMSNLATFASAAYQTHLSANTSGQLAAIVQSSDDAIIGKSLDGIITSWNAGAERLFGYSAEEVLGKAINILIPEERQDEEPAILERLRRGERIDHFETVRRRKDGSTLDISLTISPVRNAAGAITGVSKIARDITERKRAQAHITLLAREAEHRAKNMLASVEAVVHLTKASTAEDFKTAVSGRIRALANVHRLFVETRWEGS